MKKRYKTLFAILLGIVLILILPNVPNYYKNTMLKFSSLPHEFANYPTLDSLVLANKSTITTFTSAFPENALQLNDSTICISTYAEDNDEQLTSTWTKIDANGKPIDSLMIANNNVFEQERYLVNREESNYSTWLLDGDASFKPFTLVEDGRIVTEKEFKTHTLNVDYSDYDYYVDPETKNRYVKTAYYKERQWYEIHSTETYYIKKNCCSHNDILLKDIKEKLKLLHFEKERWYGDPFPDLRFHFNGKIPERWTGTGYFELQTKGKTIKLKIKYLYQYPDNSLAHIPLKYYEAANKSYLILYREQQQEGSTQFLIRE